MLGQRRKRWFNRITSDCSVMGWYMWRFSRIETKLGETLSWNTVIFNSDLFFKGQYGFHKNHSTEMASLALVDIILSFMDNGDTPIGIFLDLSKAFDTLCHNILLHKLKHYGLSKNSTGLIKNYLENRMQYVNFDNVNSHYQKISTGVPKWFNTRSIIVSDICERSPQFK